MGRFFKRNSLFLTILFAFLVTFFSVTFTFKSFYKLNKEQYNSNVFTKYSVITQIISDQLQRSGSNALFEANLALYNLHIVHSPSEAKQIIVKAKYLKSAQFQTFSSSKLYYGSVYQSKRVEAFLIEMIRYQDHIYFYIHSKQNEILLRDEKITPYRYTNLLYTYITIMSIIMIAFALILQRLQPLRRLRKKIANFGAGDLHTSFKQNGEDEISMIANEMEQARYKIKRLLESRTLFLRNVMHELKTPITKGQIASEMLDDAKQKERFKNIFRRMEEMVQEYALIEEVSSGFENEERQFYRLVDIIDEAIDTSMVERDAVSTYFGRAVALLVDFKHFSIAIKNMIDNAMKYATDQHITIRLHKEALWFETLGEKLTHPLAYYTEPFTKEQPNKDSFGLGLYIVDAICASHKIKFDYEYDAVRGLNRFIFNLPKDMLKDLYEQE